jgi:translation initiation factor IF-3
MARISIGRLFATACTLADELKIVHSLKRAGPGRSPLGHESTGRKRIPAWQTNQETHSAASRRLDQDTPTVHVSQSFWSHKYFVACGASRESVRHLSSPAAGIKKVAPVVGKAIPGKSKGGAGNDEEIMQLLDVSEVVLNVNTGEKMPMKDYRKMAGVNVLRVLEDKTTQEMSLREAVAEADELGLRAVMVSSTAKPPVVRLMNLGKVMREKQKKAKEVAKKQATQTLKELRIGINISAHDLGVKTKHAREFLAKGHRLKLFTQLQGQNRNSGEQALAQLKTIAAEVGWSCP